jgi:hypothetical protein
MEHHSGDADEYGAGFDQRPNEDSERGHAHLLLKT